LYIGTTVSFISSSAAQKIQSAFLEEVSVWGRWVGGTMWFSHRCSPLLVIVFFLGKKRERTKMLASRAFEDFLSLLPKDRIEFSVL